MGDIFKKNLEKLCNCEDKTTCECKPVEVSEAQRMFAFHYANGKNAKDSYKIISPDCGNKTAINQGSIYLNNNVVQQLIHKEKVKNGKKYLAEHEIIINNLFRRANIDPANMLDEEGKLLKPSEMDEYTRKALKIKYKAPKATKTEDGCFYQPTLFGDNQDVEIEYDPKIAQEAETKLLQLMGLTDDSNEEK